MSLRTPALLCFAAAGLALFAGEGSFGTLRVVLAGLAVVVGVQLLRRHARRQTGG